MFWFFGTGKKLPGTKANGRELRVTPVARLVRFALGALWLARAVMHWALPAVLAAAASTAVSEPAQARPKFRDKSGVLRLRGALSMGMVDYLSFSQASNAKTSFQSLPHLGRFIEGEKWLNRRTDAWPLLGLYGELENYPLRLFGTDIHYSQASAGVSVRPLGLLRFHREVASRRNWNTTEFALSGGLSLQYFPDVRAYPGTKRFDYIKPKLVGVKIEGKWNINLTRKRKWRLDARLHYIVPLKMSQVGSVDLDQGETRSFGGRLHLERVFSETIDVGVGVIYGYNKLLYKPVESKKQQLIQWHNIAPVIYLQLWIGPSGKGALALPF